MHRARALAASQSPLLSPSPAKVPLQAKTLMFVMVSPSELQLRESLASLAFGTRCKAVALGPVAANIGHSAQPLQPLPLPRPVELAAAAYDRGGSDDDVDGSSVDGDFEDNGAEA